MQNEEIFKKIQDMVQMPVHSSRDWKIMAGTQGLVSYKHMILDFSEEKKFDEDLARCFLQMNLKQGAALRVKIDNKNGIIISLDGRQIKGSQNENMIKDIIQPLIEELKKAVIKEFDPIPEHGAWYSDIPGVTKIKIDMRYSLFPYPAGSESWYIHYVTQHKMGRDGGKNYHIDGIIKSLKKDG
jgi:hypothetical protein